MSKKAVFYEEAERLYVVEGNTLEDIEAKLPVVERTLRNWKAEGDWDRKKKQRIENRRGLDEDLEVVRRKMVQSIDFDLERKEIIAGIRSRVNFDELYPLLEEESAGWEEVIAALRRTGFTIEDFTRVLKYACAGDIKVSDTRFNFIGKLSLKEARAYEELKKEKSESKEDTDDTIDLSRVSDEELDFLDKIAEKLEGKEAEER